MIDRETLNQAFALMSDDAQHNACNEAATRGMPVADVMLERCLDDVQGQLYALRTKGRTSPELRVVKGGRA